MALGVVGGLDVFGSVRGVFTLEHNKPRAPTFESGVDAPRGKIDGTNAVLPILNASAVAYEIGAL